MKTLKDSRNSIVWNIVAVFSLIGVITFFGIYLNEFNEASNIIGYETTYGSEIFLCWMFIISSSIALVYNILRIYYKIRNASNNANSN